jgi:hypothetical protein
MDSSLSAVYDRWRDDYDDEFIDAHATVAIEEWTVRDPADDVKSLADWVAEMVAERVGEDEATEDYYEAWMDAAAAPVVLVAFTAALDLMASKVVGWRMADQLVATHTITHDANGTPMLDGEALYRAVAP